MNITQLEVPEGKVVFVTVTVKDLANNETLVGNVIFGADIVELDPPSDELTMLADTALAVCQGHREVIKTLVGMGYMPIIEDDDDCLATELVPDDISGLE